MSELTHESCSEALTLLFRQGKVSIDHLHEVRGMLEIETAGLAAVRAQPGDIEQMEDVILRMDQCLDNPDAYIDADFDLYLALA